MFLILICSMTDWVFIIIAAIACYAFVAYLEHKKKLDLIDRGLWKPEEKQEKPEHAVWLVLHRTEHGEWIENFGFVNNSGWNSLGDRLHHW